MRPDIIELLPGYAFEVKEQIHKEIDTPLIGGGLISDRGTGRSMHSKRPHSGDDEQSCSLVLTSSWLPITMYVSEYIDFMN